MEMYVLSKWCRTPPVLDPRELLLHKMIMVVFGSIHPDYTDRNALIMICGSLSSEVCQKTVNVKSPPVVSNYLVVWHRLSHTHTFAHTHTDMPSSPSRTWPMSLLLPPLPPRCNAPREMEWRAGSCRPTTVCVFVCVRSSGGTHMFRDTKTLRENGNRIQDICCKAVRAVCGFIVCIC